MLLTPLKVARMAQSVAQANVSVRRRARKYFGVVFEQDEKLPRVRNAVRSRRLGMDARVMDAPMVSAASQMEEGVLLGEASPAAVQNIARNAVPGTKPQLTLKAGYQYRESNTEIGRLLDDAAAKMRPFKHNNRWLAWRKRTVRREKATTLRQIKSRKKGKDAD